MLRAIDQYFMQKEEPAKSCLLALRNMLLAYDPLFTEAWKYGMPFYCINGKMCCYLWMHKVYKQPYLGIVAGKHIEHPLLLQEKRAKMKILLIDPKVDLPVDTIHEILKVAVAFYTK